MSGLESVNTIATNSAEATSTVTRERTVGASVVRDAAGRAVPSERAAEAVAAFDSEVELLPPVPDAPVVIAPLMRNALILVEAGEFQLAMNLLRNVLMRKPNDPEALKNLGRCLRETGRLLEAEKCFRAFAARRPCAESFALLAETLYLLNRDGDARAVYEETLRYTSDTSPQLFDIYKNLGNIHVRAGDFDAAEECYHKANTLRADSDTLMVNYGTLEIQRENFAAAVERFRAAVALNPRNDKGWVGLALVHRQMGDFDLSRANIEQALDINPRNRTALHLLVEWNAVDRDFDPSVRRLAEYLAVESEDAEMSLLLAKILTHLNRLGEALIETERAISLDPLIEGGSRLYETLRNEIRRRTENA